MKTVVVQVVGHRHCVAWFAVVALLGALLVSSELLEISSASSQATLGSIRGDIEDDTRALWPGVSVKAIQVDTGVAISTLSSAMGSYKFEGLQPGKYTVSAELSRCFSRSVNGEPGVLMRFRPGAVHTVTVKAADSETLNLTLQAERVSREAECPK